MWSGPSHSSFHDKLSSSLELLLLCLSCIQKTFIILSSNESITPIYLDSVIPQTHHLLIDNQHNPIANSVVSSNDPEDSVWLIFRAKTP